MSVWRTVAKVNGVDTPLLRVSVRTVVEEVEKSSVSDQPRQNTNQIEVSWTSYGTMPIRPSIDGPISRCSLTNFSSAVAIMGPDSGSTSTR